MPTKSVAKSSKVISDIEKEALRDTIRERKAQSRRRSGNDREEGEAEVQAKIAELPPPDRAMAKRIHELVTSSAPSLVPRTFYGMPAYAKIVDEGESEIGLSPEERKAIAEAMTDRKRQKSKVRARR